MPDEITEKVLSIIATVKRIPRERVSVQSTFAELGLDSLDAINVMFELEGQFDVSIPDDQVRSLHSVQEVIEGVRKLLAGEAEPAAEKQQEG